MHWNKKRGRVAGSPGAEPNGLARVPQMGWNSWNYEEHFCESGGLPPSRCLNETFMVAITDAVASSGMQAAGYDLINLSEAWPAPERAANGSLVADPVRFPRGVQWLSDYIQLRFGIYLDVGSKTCAGFPGSLGHEALDVATIAAWGADYVWLDGCNFAGNASEYLATYERWGALFDASGRDIVWENSLPAYQMLTAPADLELQSSFSHEWRFFDDIRPDWREIMTIVDYTVGNSIQRLARPGQWPLMDMLEVGNPGLSLAESRSHFSLWAMFAQPLHAGNDVSSMSADVRDILLNAEVSSVDRDPLGRAGFSSAPPEVAAEPPPAPPPAPPPHAPIITLPGVTSTRSSALRATSVSSAPGSRWPTPRPPAARMCSAPGSRTARPTAAASIRKTFRASGARARPTTATTSCRARGPRTRLRRTSTRASSRTPPSRCCC